MEAIKYVYDSKDRKYGIAIAILGKDSRVMVGLARCNIKADNFNKKKAVELARARAIKWGYVTDISRQQPSIDNWLSNTHIESYLEKFNNHNDEIKFMKAIDYVLNRVLTRRK